MQITVTESGPGINYTIFFPPDLDSFLTTKKEGIGLRPLHYTMDDRGPRRRI